MKLLLKRRLAVDKEIPKKIVLFIQKGTGLSKICSNFKFIG